MSEQIGLGREQGPKNWDKDPHVHNELIVSLYQFIEEKSPGSNSNEVLANLASAHGADELFAAARRYVEITPEEFQMIKQDSLNALEEYKNSKS